MVSFYDDTFSVENPDHMLLNAHCNYPRDLSTFDDLPAELIQSLTEDASFDMTTTPTLTVTPAFEPLPRLFSSSSPFSSPFSSPLSSPFAASAFLSAPSSPFSPPLSPADPASSPSSSSSAFSSPPSSPLLAMSPTSSFSGSSFSGSPFAGSPFASSAFLSRPSSPLLCVPMASTTAVNSNLSAPPSPASMLFDNTASTVPSDCSECTILPAKRVLFRPRDSHQAHDLPLTEFYKRIQSPAVTRGSLISSHPHFDTHDDAVGVFYILKNVSARKPPQIDGRSFNCHTRRDAGAAHWQYNVPGTDFTCRVSQWNAVDSETGEETVYTSYHYYRSPVARRSKMGYSPY